MSVIQAESLGTLECFQDNQTTHQRTNQTEQDEPMNKAVIIIHRKTLKSLYMSNNVPLQKLK